MTDAFIVFQYVDSYFLCTNNLYKIFSKTVYFDMSLEKQFQSLSVLIVSENVLSLYAVFLMYLFNTCLAIDLILMLKYPFSPKEKRMTIYLYGSLVVGLLPTACIFLTVDYRQENYLPAVWALYVGLSFPVVYFLVAFASICYAVKKLKRPGISKESQKLVLVRHALAIIGF
jgi:hypothetical protein